MANAYFPSAASRNLATSYAKPALKDFTSFVVYLLGAICCRHKCTNDHFWLCTEYISNALHFFSIYLIHLICVALETKTKSFCFGPREWARDSAVAVCMELTDEQPKQFETTKRSIGTFIACSQCVCTKKMFYCVLFFSSALAIINYFGIVTGFWSCCGRRYISVRSNQITWPRMSRGVVELRMRKIKKKEKQRDRRSVDLSSRS